jgi:hypothetical protein
MNLDLDTLQSIKHFINKRITQIKEDLVYHVDTIDRLSYSRGKTQRFRNAASGS